MTTDEVQLNRAMLVLVNLGWMPPEGANRQPCFLQTFALGRDLRGLAGFDLPSRKLPQPRQRHSFRTLTDQDIFV